MGSKWRKLKLRNVIRVKHGWPFKSRHFSELLTGGPIVIAVGNFDYSGGFRFASTKQKEYLGEYPKEFELDPGDILLVMTCQTSGGEILGIPAVVPADGRCYLHNQRLGKVEVVHPEEVAREFLYYLFLWPQFNRHLYATASGTKILHTSPSRIEEFTCWIPPLAEQCRIAAILGALDDKIELNHQMNRTLEEMAQALFQAWFVDFEGESDLVESELGLIPRGWEVARLGDLAREERITLQPSDVEPGTPYFGLADMPAGSMELSKWGQASDVTSAKRSFQEGDILFGKLRPYFKKVGVAPCSGVCSSDILVIQPREKDWLGPVLCLLTSDTFIRFTEGSSTGTRMPRVSWQTMAKYPIAVPREAPTAARLSDAVGLFVKKIHANIHQSRTLAEIRDTLLPKLISGEIRVPEAEEVLEEIV